MLKLDALPHGKLVSVSKIIFLRLYLKGKFFIHLTNELSCARFRRWHRVPFAVPLVPEGRRVVCVEPDTSARAAAQGGPNPFIIVAGVTRTIWGIRDRSRHFLYL